MPDEELRTVTEKYSQAPTHLWKLPQQPAGKLASYLDQLVEKTSNAPLQWGTRIALIRAEPIFAWSIGTARANCNLL
jgi:hypothetical protein